MPPYDGPVEETVLSKSAAEKQRKSKRKCGIAIEYVDIIQDKYWEVRPWIISGSPGKLKQEVMASIAETSQD
jgi:tRNA(His) guanylyltransferase